MPMPLWFARCSSPTSGRVSFYKLGLELFMSGGTFELLDWMVGRGKRVFVDLKFFDVPATVAGAVRNLRNRGVTFATVWPMVAQASYLKEPRSTRPIWLL